MVPESDAHEPMEVVNMSDSEAEQKLLAYFSLQDTVSKEALAHLSKEVSGYSILTVPLWEREL